MKSKPSERSREQRSNEESALYWKWKHDDPPSYTPPEEINEDEYEPDVYDKVKGDS